MEGGGTISDIYQSSKRILLHTWDGLERLERLESSSTSVDSAELAFSIKRDIAQIQSLCVEMDRLYPKASEILGKAEEPEKLAGPLLADTYVTLLKGSNAWYGQTLAKGELSLDMGDSIKGKGMIQGVSAVGAFYALLSQPFVSVLDLRTNKPIAPVELCPILKTLHMVLIKSSNSHLSSVNLNVHDSLSYNTKVHFVFKELVRMSIGETQELKRFPTLQAEIAAAANETLEIFYDDGHKTVARLVEMESSYLTTEFFRKLPQEVERGGNPVGARAGGGAGAGAAVAVDHYTDGHFRRIASNVQSYVAMILETLKNTIPKVVVYCQVQETKRSLLNHFYTQLAKEMLDEDSSLM